MNPRRSLAVLALPLVALALVACGSDAPAAQSGSEPTAEATTKADRKKDRCTTSEDVTVAWRSLPLAVDATVADFEALLNWADEQTACDDDAQVQIEWLVDSATANIERLQPVS